MLDIELIKKSIKEAQIEYSKHYFHYEVEKSNSAYKVNCFDDLIPKTPGDFNNRWEMIDYSHNNIEQIIRNTSINCSHLLHDDSWMKFKAQSEKLKEIFEEIFDYSQFDEDQLLFINSINSDDISDMNFLKFVNVLSKNNCEIMYTDFDEDTENIKWIVIYKVK